MNLLLLHISSPFYVSYFQFYCVKSFALLVVTITAAFHFTWGLRSTVFLFHENNVNVV